MVKLIQAIQEDDVPRVESILQKMLEKEPSNTELWLKLCLTELRFPFEDYNSALKCIEKIYEIDPNHIEALIIEGGIHRHSFGFVDQKLFKKLDAIQLDDKATMAIIYYLKSFYYYKDEECKQRKEMLEKSVELNDTFVYPYKNLGFIFEKEGDREKARGMMQCAIKNVKKVYQDDDFYDFTNSNVYIAEFITGTAISILNYEILLEREKEYSSI